MANIALLALEPSDGTVVLTSIVLVFAMLIALCLIIMAEGKIFDSINNKNKPAKPQPPAPKAAAPAPKPQPVVKAQAAPPAPAVQATPVAGGAIPGEVIAAISAAVACLMGEGAVVRGVRRVAAPAGSRRGVWGDAAAREQTTPFM